MPVKAKMSWNKRLMRWEKMKAGERVYVTCQQLGLDREEWTKEGSVQAANQWWQDTLDRAVHPHASTITKLQSRLDYSKRYALDKEATEYQAQLDLVKGLPADASQIELEPNRHNQAVNLVWQDRKNREQYTPLAKTIKVHVANFVESVKNQAIKGKRSHESADGIRRALKHFTDFLGESNHIDAINTQNWTRWYEHTQDRMVLHDRKQDGGWSAETAAKFFMTSRAFVDDLSENVDDFVPPKNLRSKKHKFERAHNEIKTFTMSEATALFTQAKGIHRLIMLLMANTGMTSKDIADLTIEEIDFAEGRITRRRSKMKNKKASRLVSHKLWPEVVALLKEHCNKDGELALTTKSGQPWVWSETTEQGRLKKSDNVATIYNRIRHRLGITKSVKIFRKTSATLLRGNSEHRDARAYFLGHKERSVTDNNYADISQTQLDAAVDWLRTQYVLPQ